MDKNDIRFARVAGCSTGYIIRKHLIKGAFGEIAVLATLDTGAIILNISALSFLGLGVQPPTAEWGMMLNEARQFVLNYPYIAIAPGVVLLITVLGFNLLGDGLNDRLVKRRSKT